MNRAPAPIDFWFDFASPYGYFMSERIDALAARHGRTVRWRPVLLFAVLRALDMPAPLGHEIKRAYMWNDFARSARHLALPFRMPADFPAASQHAARAFYMLEAIDPRIAREFAHAALRAYFREGVAIGDLRQIAQLVRDVAPGSEAPEELAVQIAGDRPRQVLAAAIDEAVAQRVFGSPMVVIDGEAFFGVDRLAQIEDWLAGRLGDPA